MWDSTAKALKQHSSKLERLFQPQELQDLQEIVELGQKHGEMFISSSKTSQGHAFQKAVEGIKQAPFKAAASIGGKDFLEGTKAAGREAASAPKQGLLGAIKKPRSGFENRLKAAQSVAPQTYRNEQQ